MTVGGIVGALRRRWYVVVAGLLLSAGLVWGVYNVTPPEYTARGLILLLPSVPADEEGANPFLGLGGLDLPARVLVASYSSNAAQQEIADRAPDAEVLVSIEESTRGPIIAIDVTDTSAQGTLDTLAYVADSIPETLAALQSDVGVPLDAVVRSMPLTMDTEAEPENDSLLRLMILAGAGGLALTFILAYAADGIMQRRVRRRSSQLLSEDVFGASERHDPDGSDSGPDTEVISVLRGNLPASPRPATPSRRSDARVSGPVPPR